MSRSRFSRGWKKNAARAPPPPAKSLLAVSLSHPSPSPSLRNKPLSIMASLAAFKPVAIRNVRASRASAVVPVAAFPSKYVVPSKCARGGGGEGGEFPLLSLVFCGDRAPPSALSLEPLPPGYRARACPFELRGSHFSPRHEESRLDPLSAPARGGAGDLTKIREVVLFYFCSQHLGTPFLFASPLPTPSSPSRNCHPISRRSSGGRAARAYARKSCACARERAAQRRVRTADGVVASSSSPSSRVPDVVVRRRRRSSPRRRGPFCSFPFSRQAAPASCSFFLFSRFFRLTNPPLPSRIKLKKTQARQGRRRRRRRARAHPRRPRRHHRQARRRLGRARL